MTVERKMVGMKVESIMISCAYDIHRGGEKIGSFVSMTFKLDEPLTIEETLIPEIEGSKLVTRAAIMNGVARGAYSVDVAKDMIKASDDRHSAMIASIQKKNADSAE